MTRPDGGSGDPPGLSQQSPVAAVRSLYDRWAALYDWNPVLEMVRPARRRAISAMALRPGDTVVDMGTGTGANLRYLREAVGAEGQVIGIDVSPRMLAKARGRVQAEGWSNVTLLEGDVRDPPIGGPVDGILSTFVVVMYADPGPLVETWAELVEDGALANLYAGRSGGAAAPVVNRLLALYLRLFEEGWDDRPGEGAPLDVLAGRGERACAALSEHADRVARETHALGLVHLDVGYLDP